MINKIAASVSFLVLFFLFFYSVQAQSPKRELRGVWIATVLNIDYPRVATPDDRYLAKEWTEMLEKLKPLGINALFVQIRSTSDAFYVSDSIPWSNWLTGQSGLAPANGYDPLAYMIRTAHEMGFEFHAWLNPYRASMDNQTREDFSPSHVLNKHPEWCLLYNKRYIMNPGLPEVRKHVTGVVEEIVRKYDVDGIHFDDYFYPYKNGNEPFRDLNTFQQFGSRFSSVDDWRRDNVDQLIQSVATVIKKVKPRVQFGISPFGVWRNSYVDPLGSDTHAGVTCYDDLYADVRKWLQLGWIDYVVPQDYWATGFNLADHEKVARWWADNSYGKPVYIGYESGRIGQVSKREPNWIDPNEMPRQLSIARGLKSVKGAVFFSAKSLLYNPLGFSDSLKNNYFREFAIPPEVVKDTSMLACEPSEIRAIIYENTGVHLRWKTSCNVKKNLPFQYLIYRFNWGKVDFSDSRNILAIIPEDVKELTFYDKNAKPDDTYLYAVTVTDCKNNEMVLNTARLRLPIQDLPSHAVLMQLNNMSSKYKKKKKFWLFAWL